MTRMARRGAQQRAVVGGLPLLADGVAELARVGELLIPGHLASAERPDVNESGIDWTGDPRTAVPASGHHASVIQREDLVGIGSESFHVREDRLEHVLGDRLTAPVDATV